MREILYVQVGSLPNYIGAHFWNAQQSYFTYEDKEDVVIDHDVSFREGVSEGEQAYCPRVLIFDRKSNFGTLGRVNHLHEAEITEDMSSLWGGPVAEFRQDPVPSSTYQSRLDEEVEVDAAERDDTNEPLETLRTSDVRYWSDYNRVYYLPRSVQALPDGANWDSAEADWQSGKEIFSRWQTDTSFMEDSFRSFLEECDAPQGIHVTSDNNTFGSFTNAFLTAYRDEYPKLTSLSFPILSNAIPGNIDVDDLRGIRQAVNDAMCLRSLNELSTMNVPIQNPLAWRHGKWLDELTVNFRSPYEVSAILSSHMETATLPLRMKSEQPTLLSELCEQLNPHTNPPFAELHGVFPVLNDCTADLEPRFQNFTGSTTAQHASFSFRRDVVRGFADSRVAEYEEWTHSDKYEGAAISSALTRLLYPLPSSFPSFFCAQHLNADARRTRRGIMSRPRSTPMLSSFALSTETPALFSRYATFVERCVRRKIDWQLVGAEEDDARELVNDLWTLSDSFAEMERGAKDVMEEDYGEDVE